MRRKSFSHWYLLLLAALHLSAPRTVRGQDSSTVARLTRNGTWSATSGTLVLMGTWTAVPDSAHRTVTGTWALKDNQGKTLMYGGWSAIKAADRWYGNWRAVAAGRSGEYSGTWDSSVDIKGAAQFADLFEKGVGSVVNGTWRSDGKIGAWAIRTAETSPPPV